MKTELPIQKASAKDPARHGESAVADKLLEKVLAEYLNPTNSQKKNQISLRAISSLRENFIKKQILRAIRRSERERAMAIHEENIRKKRAILLGHAHKSNIADEDREKSRKFKKTMQILSGGLRGILKITKRYLSTHRERAKIRRMEREKNKYEKRVRKAAQHELRNRIKQKKSAAKREKIAMRAREKEEARTAKLAAKIHRRKMRNMMKKAKYGQLKDTAPEKTAERDMTREAMREAVKQVLVEKEKSKIKQSKSAVQPEISNDPTSEDLKSKILFLERENAQLVEKLNNQKVFSGNGYPQDSGEKSAKPNEQSNFEPSNANNAKKQIGQEKIQPAKERAHVEQLKTYGIDKITRIPPTTEEERVEIMEKALSESQARFKKERESLLRRIAELENKPSAPANAAAPAMPAGMEAIENERKKIAAERAGLEEERAIMREEARKEAYNKLEGERTRLRIAKENMKQRAIAEAETKILSTLKNRNLFGIGQHEKLGREIDRWKKEADKVEKQRINLEKIRALQSEEARLHSAQRDIEENKIKAEIEKVEQDRAELTEKEKHEENIRLHKTKLEEKKKLLEEEKMEFEKSGKKKKDKKKMSKEEIEKENQRKIKIRNEKIDIGKILVSQNYLEKSELDAAQKEARERNVTIETILKEEGFITTQIIQNAIAEYYDIPFVDLSSNPPDTSVVELLPEDVATEMHAIAVKKDQDGSLTIATSNPAIENDIKKAVKKLMPDTPDITIVYASKRAIESSFSFYRKPLDTRFRKIIEQHKKIAPEIIEEIFADAIQLGASDVHFEPQEKTVIVRFRVDGVMHEAGRLPKEYYEGVINRIKIAGNMRIDEHFAAQDGAIRWKSGGRSMDVRVSIVPLVDGEKIVMRLLSEYVRTLTLSDLGFTEKQLNVLVKTAHKPFGMILTTGPTGSGKSTTLYGLMKIRNSPDVNISTIEDPVEYKIPGINHIQVNRKANLTFERGLRALVRQDPDIILVGEIRDNVTAQISVNAALTGHLLFSTLHANDAATAVPRLLEMGIEPFLLASTLELIIAQRLMRRTCGHCRYSYNVPYTEAEQLFQHAEYFLENSTKDLTLYRGKGCSACGNTGYRGRIGVYELLVVTPEIEELIIKRRTSGEINNMARKQGMLTLFEDGLQKAITGVSTIEELLRIAAPPLPPDTANDNLKPEPDDDKNSDVSSLADSIQP